VHLPENARAWKKSHIAPLLGKQGGKKSRAGRSAPCIYTTCTQQVPSAWTAANFLACTMAFFGLELGDFLQRINAKNYTLYITFIFQVSIKFFAAREHQALVN
jgi:hypothetical protein